MKITYLGHASFKIEGDGKTIFVDPWLTGPKSTTSIDKVDKADIVLVTHDHGDHGYAEAIKICKKTGATFVAINELGIKAKDEGVSNVHTLNIGGSVMIEDVVVTLVQAFHSSAKGGPTGFIVKFPSGTFYHAGDTGIFSTMKIFGELYKPDVCLLPIGSYYTMDIQQAAMATKLLNPKYVIPMHYDTFPVIQADPKEFKELVRKVNPETETRILKPGESTEI
ncbi:MAG: metal-dependent hydrolase [Candidatus Lokiarchaeota archaeon]|nr:metal-dependent hydrolase [Candidatus Lokiarchaeota archaeon]